MYEKDFNNELVPQTNLRRVYFNTSDRLFSILKKYKFDGDFSFWLNSIIVEKLKREGIITEEGEET